MKKSFEVGERVNVVGCVQVQEGEMDSRYLTIIAPDPVKGTILEVCDGGSVVVELQYPQRSQYGQTEEVIVPVSELIRDRRHQIQTTAIVQLINYANKLGLEGKRVTELVSRPTFAIGDLHLSLKWEQP